MPFNGEVAAMLIEHDHSSAHRASALLGVLALHALVLAAALGSRLYSQVTVPALPPRIEVHDIEPPRNHPVTVDVAVFVPRTRAQLDPPPLPPVASEGLATLESPVAAPADPPVTQPGPADPVHPATLDPAHPLHIGPEYYPPASIRLHEEGRCQVLAEVTREGRIEGASLAQRTGSARLDAACLAAVKGQRMRPATVRGQAIDSKVLIPIAWQLAP